VDCPHPSTLVRRVQYMSGWTATLDGRTALPVSKDKAGPIGLYQLVSVPAGVTTLHFSYRPPYETFAIIGAAIACLILVGTFVTYRSRRYLRADSGRDDQR
ncbi:MAG: hypothetical protein ACRD1G_02120, partial [Acidimicrobiales bacterium]